MVKERETSETMNTAVLAGLGNAGSNLVPLLPSLGLGSVVLVDRDVYEEKNLMGQSIAESFVGHPKAVMQAERLSRFSRRLNVTPLVDEIQNVPWKKLQCDVILGCFDNNLARQITAEFAWRMKIPYVDAGVRRDGLFARVDVYIPDGDDAPCIECSWKNSDYERLEMQYPCGKDRMQYGTDSPVYLGSLAASIQAVECARILKGDFKNGGTRIVLSAHSYSCYISRLQRNRECRFDHQGYTIEQLESIGHELSVQQVLDNGDVSTNMINPARFVPETGHKDAVKE
jgi:molybdopterin/thiamine biosynthesis adenylyltransferase